MLTPIWNVLVGLIFLGAAILKSIDFESLRPVFFYFGVTDARHYLLGLLSIVIIESMLGFLMLAFPTRVKLTLVAAIALIALSTVPLYLYFAVDAPACGCLGKLELWSDARRSNLFAFGRNLLLVLPGAACVGIDRQRGRGRSTMPARLRPA